MKDIVKFTDKITGYSLMFDEDSRVAYSYLLDRNNKIIAGLWLYNISDAPIEPEWNDREKSPYLNAKAFVTDEKIKPIEDTAVLRVGWIYSENKRLKRVEIFIYDELVGVMTPSMSRGWSRFASKIGPLARPLCEFEELKRHNEAELKNRCREQSK